jgi:hypothetical protein
VVAAVAPGADAKAEIEFLGAVRALATAAGMFDLTEGDSDEGEAAADEEGDGAGSEDEEGPF